MHQGPRPLPMKNTSTASTEKHIRHWCLETYKPSRLSLQTCTGIMAMDTSTMLSGISTLIAGLLLTALLICGYTFASTSIFFRQDIQNLQARSKKDESSVPPMIPYVVPALGSTITFSNQRIGDFFEYMRMLSRKYGGLTAFSIMLSGTRTHFIFSAQSIASAFKSRQLSRDKLDIGKL